MRPSEKRDGAPEVRIGRHRAKLDEIRESLKAYEHENSHHHTSSSTSVVHTDISDKNDNGSDVIPQSSPFRTETAPTHKSRVAPMPQRHLGSGGGMGIDMNEMGFRNMMNVPSSSSSSNRNGNINIAQSFPQIAQQINNMHEEMMRMHQSASAAAGVPPIDFRHVLPPGYYSNNNMPQLSPVYQRPPPPAYDSSPSNSKRMTPVASDNYRTHLHINTQPKSPNIPIFHHKNMAPPPPGKSTISIETNVNDEISRRNDNIQRLYHTSMDKKTTNSVVSINVASPHTTKVNLGDSPMSTKSFVIGPRYTTDIDRSKIFLNYTDELRQDPRMIPSTSDASFREEDMRHILFKPSNLDITFQSRQQQQQQQQQNHQNHQQVYNENSKRQDPPKRVSSPIDKELLDPYFKNTRNIQSCKPNMFRFYMEQHVERLVQQYREREKRMRQLEKEMNAADLPVVMRQKMLEFLQQKESRYTRLRRQKMTKDNFIVISHIGLGAFGKVSLVRKKDTGKAYAMKTLEKADVIMKQQDVHVKAERDILAEADSSWIVRLFFSFQDDAYLYFIMEYVPGGDMMTLLIQKGVFEESLARFYIAELTCAIEYVHSVGFIHRDIKPDNILIDQYGHIKLTDFGLCTGLRWTHDRRYYGPENEHQRVDSFSLPPEVAGIEKSTKVLNVRQQSRRQFAHSVVGTSHYMAPEVISRTGHAQSCDWWSMGVILYEMVFGRVPFTAETQAETQYRIVRWRQYLEFTHIPPIHKPSLSTECLSMIQQLVCDVGNRVGSRGGAAQIKDHPWFKGINFDTLRKSKAEYIPMVAHEEDTSNFDTFQVNDKTVKQNVRALNNPAFYEFTYRHFFDTDSLGCPSLRPPLRRRSLRPLLEDGVFEESTITEDDASHI